MLGSIGKQYGESVLKKKTKATMERRLTNMVIAGFGDK